MTLTHSVTLDVNYNKAPFFYVTKTSISQELEELEASGKLEKKDITLPNNAASLTTLWHHVDPNHSVASSFLCISSINRFYFIDVTENVYLDTLCSTCQIILSM